jgi:hypothetical protein
MGSGLITLFGDDAMAMYLYVDGKQVIEHGTPGRCKCGEPAETKIDYGGLGGGYYDEVCRACRIAIYHSLRAWRTAYQPQE